MSLRQTLFALSALASAAALVGCHNDQLPDPGESNDPVPTGDAVILSASGKVLTFNRADVTKLISSRNIRGLQSGERFLGIDVRPQDRLIYGVTNLANLYTLDDSTGLATLKFALKAGAATTATCSGGAPGTFTGLSGTEFGLDFNPAADRLRLASDTRQNLRINVADGATIVDCPITFADGVGMPTPTGAAYTNSVAGMPGTTTELYYVDSGTDTVYEIDTGTTEAPRNANNGVLSPEGPLGIDITAVSGFDIEGATRTGYGVFTVGTTTSLYTVDIEAGTATARIQFAPGEMLRGLSLK